MHSDIEKLINMALADSLVNEKEREIILNKAIKLNLDVDEVEMYLEGKIGLAKSLIIPSKKNENSINEVTIGNQTWMSKNLNVDKFRNGDPISYAKYEVDWLEAMKNKTPIYGYYENNPNNEKKFGKIYNRYALFDDRGLAPNGWEIPKLEDWKILIKYLGGENLAGEKLKSISDNWLDFGYGDGQIEFNAEPGGMGYNEFNISTIKSNESNEITFFYKFKGIGKLASFFTSSFVINDLGDINIISCLLENNSRKIKFNEEIYNEALNIRCIKSKY